MKIAIAPTVVVMEYFMFNKLPSRLMLVAVFIVCAGITGATVSDNVAINNMQGLLVGFGATLVTALYQIWAGSKQKELQANSSQLLHAYTPHATWLLGGLVPLFENVGWSNPSDPDTLLGYRYTGEAVFAIVLSAVLGILVSLTTFLVIGATSSLTYNIVGHLKTVIILTGGVFIFGVSGRRRGGGSAPPPVGSAVKGEQGGGSFSVRCVHTRPCVCVCARAGRHAVGALPGRVRGHDWHRVVHAAAGHAVQRAAAARHQADPGHAGGDQGAVRRRRAALVQPSLSSLALLVWLFGRAHARQGPGSAL